MIGEDHKIGHEHWPTRVSSVQEHGIAPRADGNHQMPNPLPKFSTSSKGMVCWEMPMGHGITLDRAIW